MKFELVVEVRINQAGNYGNALTLGDHYQMELSSLNDACTILVTLHQALEMMAEQARKTK